MLVLCRRSTEKERIKVKLLNKKTYLNNGVRGQILRLGCLCRYK
jgi:hypothetical protein